MRTEDCYECSFGFYTIHTFLNITLLINYKSNFPRKKWTQETFCHKKLLPVLLKSLLIYFSLLVYSNFVAEKKFIHKKPKKQ